MSDVLALGPNLMLLNCQFILSSRIGCCLLMGILTVCNLHAREKTEFTGRARRELCVSSERDRITIPGSQMPPHQA